MSSPRIQTEFRLWINNLWVKNCEERLIVGEQKLDPKTYFKKYKWWLKREFRHQSDDKPNSRFLT